VNQPVSLHGGALCERLSTYIAWVCSLTCVYPLVIDQSAVLTEHLTAHITWERFFTRVSQLMIQQSAVVTEHLTAHIALVSFLALVYLPLVIRQIIASIRPLVSPVARMFLK